MAPLAECTHTHTHTQRPRCVDPLPTQSASNLYSYVSACTEVHLFKVVLLRQAVNHVNTAQETAGWVFRGKSDLNTCYVVRRNTHMTPNIVEREQVMPHNYTLADITQLALSRKDTQQHNFLHNNKTSFARYSIWH